MSEKEIINNLLYKMNNYTITKQEYRYLQYLLLKNEKKYRCNYPVSKIKIIDNPLLFISDTHFGAKDEEKRNVITAYNTAIQKNIKIAIHTGDLIEACANNQYNKSYNKIIEEIYTSINYMPKEIITSLLIGNHDYSAIRTYPDIIPYFFNFENLEILGVKKALINLNGPIITINHQISQITNQKTTEEESLNLNGHFHSFNVFKEANSINLPTLARDTLSIINDTLQRQYNITFESFDEPSFLILSKQDENILKLEFYCINRNTFNLENNINTYEFNTKTKHLKKYKQL